jgi:adenylate cyclase
MAVFGLDGRSDGASAATRAGEAMLAALGAVNAELSRPIAIGIGVHRGEVVAGNIGSPDRLEYTFIGDAVNTAARIESLTRSVGAPLLVSRAVVDALPEPDRPRWHTRGAHPLKGKSEPVEVLALQ